MLHTSRLETTGIYSLKILETRSLKLKCLPSLIPSGGSEGEFVPYLSPISMVAGSPGTLLICWLISSVSAFMDWCDALSHVWLFVTPWTVAHLAPLPWNSLGKNTGEGCQFLSQGIFLTQGLNPCLLCLPHSRQILYHWATSEDAGGSKMTFTSSFSPQLLRSPIQ